MAIRNGTTSGTPMTATTSRTRNRARRRTTTTSKTAGRQTWAIPRGSDLGTVGTTIVTALHDVGFLKPNLNPAQVKSVIDLALRAGT